MEGEYAPVHLEAGFIVLSYIVSFVGSLSTLELLQLRTATKGAYNWYLLIGSAVTMGGIAIWSMHFIGNSAIILYNDEPHLQLQYSQGYTVLSVFVPMIVLFGAYLLCGTGEDTSMFWVAAGGFGAGSSISGMHYLGNAGIANYTCVYDIGYIVGAVIIAITATCVALCMFFRLRKTFTNGLWKRCIVAIILAGGVSGMHWTGVVGTRYRYHTMDNNQRPVNRRDIVILTLVMSVIACIGLVGFGIGAGRARAKRRHRVQQVTLVAASFDEDGKLMVHTDGTLPTTTITDGFRDKSFEETFGPKHWAFHWAYRTSSNWKAVENLIPGMRQHIRASTSHRSSVGSAYSVEYHFLFREQFCVAAQNLADLTHRPLSRIGVLHANLLTSGYDPERRGTGKVLFLVSQIEKQLNHHGFRFAAPETVLPVLADTMQIQQSELGKVLSDMKLTAKSPPASLPASGVYLACFAPRSCQSSPSDRSISSPPPTAGSLAASTVDIELLVDAHRLNQLPMVRLQESFLPAHTQWLRQHAHETVAQLYGFSDMHDEFESRLVRALQELESTIGDPYFRLAVLEPSIAVLADGAVRLIIFRANPPASYTSPNLRFIPFGLFDVMQRDEDLHARLIYREFSGRVHTTITGGNSNSSRFRGFSIGQGKEWSLSSISKNSRSRSTDQEPIVTDSSNFGNNESDIPHEKGFATEDIAKGSFLRAGIMVSESVTIERVTPSQCGMRDEDENRGSMESSLAGFPRGGGVALEMRNLGTSARADAEGGDMVPETWVAALMAEKSQ